MARGTTSYYGRRYTIATPMTHLYMLCACIFCWIVGYVDSVGYPVYGEVTAPPLWNALCLVLPGKLFTYLIGFLLMAGGAFLVHRVNYALMLIREKTLLPFLFYALLTSTNPDFFPLKSTSVGVFCLILALYQLFTSYHDPDATDKAYNASLIISIGSLLWIHILWFLPLFWLGMYNFRTLNIRTFVASLFGISTVYCFRMVCLGMGFHGIYHTFHLLIQDPFPCGTRDGNYRLDTDCFSGGINDHCFIKHRYT